MENNLVQNLTIKYVMVVNIQSKSTVFWKIWMSAFVRSSPHSDFWCHGSRITATTKMELFEQVT